MKIPITDQRLVALGDLSAPVVVGGAQPPVVPIDVAPPKGFAVRREGDVALFANNGSDIGVQIVDDVLVFFPDRSSQHKALLRQLGEDV